MKNRIKIIENSLISGSVFSDNWPDIYYRWQFSKLHISNCHSYLVTPSCSSDDQSIFTYNSFHGELKSIQFIIFRGFQDVDQLSIPVYHHPARLKGKTLTYKNLSL